MHDATRYLETFIIIASLESLGVAECRGVYLFAVLF